MRKLLQYLLALLIGFAIIFLLLWKQVPSSAHVKTDDIVQLDLAPTASITELSPHYEKQKTFLSEVYEADEPFQLLGLNWLQELPDSTTATLEIRFFTVEDEWTDWQEVHEDQDGAHIGGGGLYTYFITEDSDAFQYRAYLSTEDTSVTPKLSDIFFDYINGGTSSPFEKLTKLVFKNHNDNIVSRDNWGADETLRLTKSYSHLNLSDDEEEIEEEDDLVADDPDMEIIRRVEEDNNGNELLWALEYPKKVKKIIIHHTATTKNLDDPEKAIRAIYQYHAITRGWGDIGYNFIIAPDGMVYEGRYGGDGVVAGHAAGYNTGSVGIALLGDYEDTPIPGEMMQSLTDLVYELSDLHGIDPDSSGKFRGEVMQNILGHSDVGSTRCPGGYTYDYLDDIRRIVGASLDNLRHTNSSELYAYEETTDRDLITLEPNDSSSVLIKIKNMGTKSWNSDTFVTVNANYEADQIVEVDKDSQKRVAMMQESYVAPGKTATFAFSVESGMTGGLAHFDVAPVFNGSEKTRNYMDLGVFVERPFLDFSVKSSNAPDELKPGESATVTLKLKNEGNVPWENTGDYKVQLTRQGSSSLTSSSTLATLKESKVDPGETGTFTFKIKAPSSGGDYTLYFAPSMENSNAAVSSSAQLSVEVANSNEDAIVTGASSDLEFEGGETKTVWIQVKNNTSKKWSSSGRNAFTLAFTKPNGVEISGARIASRSVTSGGTVKVYFDITAPNSSGDYKINIRPRLGSTNLTRSAYQMTITVGEVTAADTSSYENPIRIKLTPDNGVGTPVLTADSSFTLYDDETVLKTFAANSRVRITPQGDQFYVTSGLYKWTVDGPVRFTPAEDGIAKILTMDQRPAWNPLLNDNEFRGTIEVRNLDGETILINELPLEDYLKGLAEVSQGTHEEKIKTIVVLARSYASYYMTKAEKFPGMPYHLDDDPDSSQKYLGYGFEKRGSDIAAAVEATRGEVVTYNGELIKTPYFSKSDGSMTKSAYSVWGWTDTPYLVPVSDAHCDSDAFDGHGVGLSGCGADAFAQDGYTYDEIIRYYYTGALVSTL